MDDALLVRVGDRVADLLEDRKTQLHLVRRQRSRRTLPEPRGQRRAAHQLHREEVQTVLGGAGLVERRDAGMPEMRERLRFALEELERLGGDVRSAADDLERDGTAGMLLLGFVDDAHAAFAELTHQAEVADESVGAYRAAAEVAVGEEAARGRERLWSRSSPRAFR